MQTNIRVLQKISAFGILPLTEEGESLLQSDKIIDFYRVWGVAPSYTNHPIAEELGCDPVFHNLHMNWWVWRPVLVRNNYRKLFGGDYDFRDTLFYNQMFLKEEAELFKNWIDSVFPEENTTIEKIEPPYEKREPYPRDFNTETKRGCFLSYHRDWNYAFNVCYYIEL